MDIKQGKTFEERKDKIWTLRKRLFGALDVIDIYMPDKELKPKELELKKQKVRAPILDAAGTLGLIHCKDLEKFKKKTVGGDKDADNNK